MHLIAALASVVALIFLNVAPSHAEKRVALVIGNGTYQNTPALSNPVNDADDMAVALRTVGFEVLIERNVNKRSLEMRLAQFGRLAQEADAVLFYYAGHGIQYRGMNYLMPTDARLEDEFSVNFELTRIDDVLFALSSARGVKILILDACRNNPLADRLMLRASNRDIMSTRGLARIEAPRGMIIAYATQSNQVAVDGTGRNSPFTSALLKEIEQPGLEIAALFRRVAANVNRATGGRQLPELSISMFGEFFLNTRDTDVQAWARLRSSTDVGQLNAFLMQYPNSPLIVDVQERLAVLDRMERERLEQARRAQREREQIEKERQAREQAEIQRVERLVREQAERERLVQEQRAREELERELRAGEIAKPKQFAREDAEGGSIGAEGVENRRMAIVTVPSELPPSQVPGVPSGSQLILEIKKELKRVGCYAGQLDGKWATAETKASIQNFTRYANLPPVSGEADASLLDAIRGRAERVCPLNCGKGWIERNGRCIANANDPDKAPNKHGNSIVYQKPKPTILSAAPNTASKQEPHKNILEGADCKGFAPRQCLWFLTHPHPQ